MATACGLLSKGETKPADPAPDKVKLDGAQIDQLVRGNTLMIEEYGVKAKVELHPDGTLRAFKQDYNDQTRGTRDVEGDALCMKFKRWGEGDEQCYAVYKVGEEYQQYTASGLIASRFTVTTGVAHAPVAVKGRRPHRGTGQGWPPSSAHRSAQCGGGGTTKRPGDSGIDGEIIQSRHGPA
jgi:hypothetical protein